MTSRAALRAQLIWATRGRAWGFRFLLDAGLNDPLPEYERAFSGATEELATWACTEHAVAVRLPDPRGRRDSAGRTIPHEFVAFGPLTDSVNSVDDGLTHLWPLVETAYEHVWNQDAPPVSGGLIFD